ncbi:MAG: hypothetical protein ABI054_01505, partial [Planctomycetota bacterium]
MELTQFPGAMQRAALAQLGLLALWACATQPRIPKEFLAPRAERGFVESGRLGPEVIAGDSGPARFAKPLFEHFDVERAMATVRFVDSFYRSPGNDGFEASLDHVEAALREAGFGTRQELLLEVISTPLGSPAWTPISARLELTSQGKSRVLHSFDTPGGADRTMLPVGAPSGSAQGRPVFGLDELEPGTILVVDDASKGDSKAAA